MGIVRKRITGPVDDAFLKREINKNVRAMARMSGDTPKQIRQDLKDMEDYFFPKKSRFRR